MKISGYYFLVLDIETSTLKKYNPDTNKDEPCAVWLSYGYCNLYNRFGDREGIFMFREWEQLRNHLNMIQMRFPSHKLLCFVHNLAYEFDFLIKNLSRPETFLTNSSHGVISSTLIDFPGIEFRCTFKLSMQSLRKIGEQIGVEKFNDTYSMILPKDEIPPKRLQYCCRDCDIVAGYIVKVILPEFKTFYNIPLTKTGRVRKTFYKFYEEEKEHLGHAPDWDLPPDEDCFEAMERAFSGGIVISNPMFTGRVLSNVHSYDIRSSYPYAQLKENFPVSISREYNIEKRFLLEPFWIAKIAFTNIHSKYTWGWLSVSKMDNFDELTSEFFNGKLLHSSTITRTITSVDYETMKMTYTWDDIEILEFYHMYKYGKIPYPYVKTIEVYGIKKDKLKALVKSIDETDPNFLEIMIEYMLSKNDFNSIYGMSVQKLIQQEYYINDIFEWFIKERKYKKTNKHLRRNFLIGVFTTAYARRNLIRGIVKNCAKTLVYCDTDSIKFIGEDNFIDTNEPLDEPFASNQYLCKLGRFEKEDSDAKEKPTYTKFVAWGAKKYSYMIEGSDNVFLTVAGLPKYKSDEIIKFECKNKEYIYNNIEQFKPGIVFKNCKMGKMYIYMDTKFSGDDVFNHDEIKQIDDETSKFLKDNNIHTNGGVALFPVDYSLDITDIDKRIILKTQEIIGIWLKTVGIQAKESIGIQLLTA